MKNCPSCKIKVGGDFQFCPLCQNALSGEPSEYYFPRPQKLKSLSLFYRIQLLAAFAVAVICLIADLLLKINTGFHWCWIAVLAIAVGEIVTHLLVRRHSEIYYFFTTISVGVAVLIAAGAYFFGFTALAFEFILPGLFIGVTGTLFAFCLIDKKGNVLPNLLCYVLVCVIPPVVLLVQNKEPPFMWDIALGVGLVALVGTIIFKGSTVFNEINKRLHM